MAKIPYQMLNLSARSVGIKCNDSTLVNVNSFKGFILYFLHILANRDNLTSMNISSIFLSHVYNKPDKDKRL